MQRWDRYPPPGTEHLIDAPPPALRRMPRPRGDSAARFGDLSGRVPAGWEGSRPGPRTLVLLTAMDVVVASVQWQLVQSRPACRSTICAVATLGGRPVICLALAVAAALALVCCVVIHPHPAQLELWQSVRWFAVTASVIAGVGLVVVAVAAVLLAIALIAVLLALIRSSR